MEDCESLVRFAVFFAIEFGRFDCSRKELGDRVYSVVSQNGEVSRTYFNRIYKKVESALFFECESPVKLVDEKVMLSREIYYFDSARIAEYVIENKLRKI